MDQEKPKRRVAVRRNYAPELMAAARAAYEVESLTMPLIAERLGINLHTLKKRAFLKRWGKVTTLSHPVETAALEPCAG